MIIPDLGGLKNALSPPTRVISNIIILSIIFRKWTAPTFQQRCEATGQLCLAIWRSCATSTKISFFPSLSVPTNLLIELRLSFSDTLVGHLGNVLNLS